MIAPTLALVAMHTVAVPPRPVPPPYAVTSVSGTAWGHYQRDLDAYWGRKYLADVDRRTGAR